LIYNILQRKMADPIFLLSLLQEMCRKEQTFSIQSF